MCYEISGNLDVKCDVKSVMNLDVKCLESMRNLDVKCEVHMCPCTFCQ